MADPREDPEFMSVVAGISAMDKRKQAATEAYWHAVEWGELCSRCELDLKGSPGFHSHCPSCGNKLFGGDE